MRSVPEWIGKTDDAAIPPRVRLRVFDGDKGVCQCGCGIKIRSGDAWDTDHKVALANGGENRESNLQTLLRGHHRIKTRADVAQKATDYRKRKSNLGLKKPRTIRAWRNFRGEIVIAPRER